MKGLVVVLITLRQLGSVSAVSISAPGDVVAGRPFTLVCKVNRTTGDRSLLFWSRVVGQVYSSIYASRVCTPSIPVLPSSTAGLSGGCQQVNGEEVYTVTIENVTGDTGRGSWICQYGPQSRNVSLDVQVRSVPGLSISAPGDVVASRPLTLECKVNRTTGDRSAVFWTRGVDQTTSLIYASRVCTSSIPVSPAGLSGGCQHVNGEEVYTVTIENVTEDTGRGSWICQYEGKRVDIKLNIKVIVTRVTLTNLSDAVLAGDPANFTCVTSASKPQACIRGYIQSSGNARELDPPSDCNQDSSSVQTTTRKLTFTAGAEENGAELYCNASNSVTDLPVRSQVYTLSVQYPPQIGVLLSGYVNNTAVESGETLTLTCQVGKGNPQPALSWLPGCGQPNPVSSNDGSQQISIRIAASPSLNQKTCVCKGSQDGALTGWTEQNSTTFNVFFGPDSVQLRTDSGQSGNTVTVTENSTVTFTCTSGESNPAAVLSWYNNSSPIAASEVPQVNPQQGPNHGYLTTQRYTVRVDRYQDGDVIRCEAQRSGDRGTKRVSPNLTLEVKYAPEITCNSTHVTVFEGQRVKVSCDVTSKDDVVVHWSKSGRRIDNALSTFLRSPARRDVTISTLEFESAEARLSGVYQIEARNSVGTSTREITIKVTEGQFISMELRLVSCTNNEVSLVWASGIDDSLVEYYKLEYKGTERLWKRELVKNPGRVKIVMKTLRDLQPGVFYQFRLQPNSDIALSEYATTNCTIQKAGLSKGGMLGVGVVIGAVIVTIIAVSVMCWMLRKTPSTGGKEPASDKQKTEQVMSVVQDRGIEYRNEEHTTDIEPPSHGHYEDLDTTPSSGPHYEELSGRASSSTPGDHRVYENATAF